MVKRYLADMMTARPRRALVMPRAGDPCCCGSGRTFAVCCEPNLPGVLNIAKAARAARLRDDKAAGLVALRADLSQWIILHRTNTQPAMLAGWVGIGPLVQADIANLTDAASRVSELMELTGAGGDVPIMIEGLRTVVDDPRWTRRIVYLQTLHLWRTVSLDAARREFAKIGPIGSGETDVEILRAAVTLGRDGRSFALSLSFYDRLFELSENLEDRLRALSLKAAAYVVHGDSDQAQLELAKAAAMVPENEEDDLDWNEAVALSWCLVHLGLLGRNRATFVRAEGLIRRELQRRGITALGEAVWFKELADLFRYASDPSRAVEAYREVLRRDASFPASIFLAESFLSLGLGAEADQILRALEPAQMEPDEYEDFLFVGAAVSVQTGDRAAQTIVSQRLRAFRGSAPYFEQRRLAFLLAVEDALKNGKTPGLMARVLDLLADPVQSLNRWVMLEPNMFGIGLRVNNIVTDVIGKKQPPAKN
jgi:tetratricopeptide (TPR) repeat protein